MPLMKIGEHREVVLPQELLDELSLKPGDYIDLVPRQPADYPETDEAMGPEATAALEEAIAEVRSGARGPILKTEEDIRHHLRDLERD